MFIKITVIKEAYKKIWELSSEKKGLKQTQDCSVEMTVNKPLSWVKHGLKHSSGYQASPFSSKPLMPDDLFRIQIDFFLH